MADLTNRLKQARYEVAQAMHTRDEDCTIDPATLCCRICSAEHGAACPDCGGRAFHRASCPWSVYTQEVSL